MFSVKIENAVILNEIPKILHLEHQKMDKVLPREKSGQFEEKIW